ncbi:DUF6675 family protein [Treponema endosymbiont of Eucomonympha sp.]|uniref:DUF6675 family protein n=1 Tax=Treponema endosymbiont of Eucomonympha sp. TaxID=1580831 RepID=UPI0007816606|nr:DUF6675 family protein [Treponema endosymbiont of Eucomonympha sp.]
MLRLKMFAPIVSLLLCAPLAAEVFNQNLPADEREKLAAGEVLIRNIGKAQNMSLNPANEAAERALGVVAKLNPNYLVEIIQLRPYDETLIAKMRGILTDVPAYKGIPYFSESSQTYYELYSRADVLSKHERAENGGVLTDISAELYMKPFTVIAAHIVIQTGGDTLFYQYENTNSIRTDGSSVITDNISLVRANHMQSLILVFRQDDSLILYGIGGVHAPSVPFTRKRVETSFLNRIKTFCQYVYEKI